MKITVDAVIDRPVADVFRFVAENHHANHPRWDPHVVSIEPVDAGQPALGAQFRLTRKNLGKTERHTFNYVEWSPAQALAYETSEGPMSLLIRSSFKAVNPAQTKLTLEGVANLQGPRRFLAPLIKPVITRQVRGNLERIKSLVESE